ncbi:CBF/Mak21 family-domain-containing protein [Mucidula mucida]|nr:CBF/Mak21 family-domain-containing protein [Mucidula mucida]KAF8920989.1 CBF/Mak21 family-domain-containing protein [Mucidula mucida]
MYRIFVLIVVKGSCVSGDESAKAVKTWIWERMNSYVEYLCGLMKDDERTLRTQTSFTFSTKPGLASMTIYDGSFYEKQELNAWWVEELGTKPPKVKTLKSKDGDEEEEEAENAKEDEEDDWRKFFDEDTTAKDLKKNEGPKGRVHSLTIHQSLHSLASHKAVFTRAWLELLPRLSVKSNAQASKVLATRVLNILHRGVMPHLTRPVLVMDWIGACVDYGGTVGLLALNALFALMKEYNLDYPSIYTHLYAFLDRDLFHLKHRARFFRMTELFLSSTHIPATLLASFVKRLSRLSLSAPPAGVIILIPFTYNIMKRHPALMVMIHRAEEDAPDGDPFLPEEPNPLSTNALDSSLWELQSHRTHYHSGVSTLAKIFSEAFTKPGFSIGGLFGSYIFDSV